MASALLSALSPRPDLASSQTVSWEVKQALSPPGCLSLNAYDSNRKQNVGERSLSQFKSSVAVWAKKQSTYSGFRVTSPSHLLEIPYMRPRQHTPRTPWRTGDPEEELRMAIQ